MPSQSDTNLEVSQSTLSIGICGFPLSSSRATGRGLERVVEELLTSFSKLGQEYAFYESGVIRNEIIAVIKSIGYLFKIYKKKHNIWYATYPVAGIFPIILSKKPVVTGVYDLIPFFETNYDNNIKYFIKRVCIKFACKYSDGLIVPFRSTADEISRRFKVEKRKIKIVPLGIDHSSYYFDPKIKKIKYTVGFLGEAKRAKGLDTAIRAFAIVVKYKSDSFFRIASNGNEINDMKKLAETLIPKTNYEFVGFVEEKSMRKFYSELDVFVFPSRYGFGMSAVESYACGTPAIVGHTLDSADFFTEEFSLVNPDSPEDLALKILKLFEDPDLYAHAQMWGLRNVKSLSWGKMSEKYIDFMKEISNYENVNSITNG